MFEHGESDTNIPIENVWRLLKYTFMERRVNVRPGLLLDKLFGVSDDKASVAMSVVDYYRRRLEEYILFVTFQYIMFILNLFVLEFECSIASPTLNIFLN